MRIEKRVILFLSVLLGIFIIPSVMAHCPLCTIGAGAAAGAAIWLGVSKVVVALFIGAFAMSMGMWFSRLIKKKYVPFQKTLIITIIFLTTVFPLMPLFSAIGPLYIPFIGAYGATYALNYSLGSSLLGGGITLISPGLNKKIKEKTKRGFPYQGIVLTFSLLLIASLVIQLSL
ncbi:hypothetical protein COU61_01865 [Candidatus Pacearchaeota archaeon CG10_big_fil_rev_8_21_14_0_10_35_13]|nr:MAG: hypothetical protein COU61_01865 [Candidatus Pacearchaeota archaeon CG10_big_fil_rev_8_21_14_0_10_35_13]